MYTPEIIINLGLNEVFVFGSNKNGFHIGGAADIAFQKFEAKWGNSEGLQGKSYAIPTLDENMKKVSEEALEASIDRFINFVLNNRQFTFYLTKIGCGIAGWSIEDIKRIFWNAMGRNSPSLENDVIPCNLIIPKEFLKTVK